MPTVPLALVELVMTGADGGGGITASVSVAVPVATPLVAPSVTVNMPRAEGVPEINPVPVLTVRPAGNPAAE